FKSFLLPRQAHGARRYFPIWQFEGVIKARSVQSRSNWVGRPPFSNRIRNIHDSAHYRNCTSAALSAFFASWYDALARVAELDFWPGYFRVRVCHLRADARARERWHLERNAKLADAECAEL